MAKIRTLIVDDQPIFRAGLQAGLEKEVEILAVDPGTGDLAARVAELDPEIVLVDISPLSVNDTASIRAIKESTPDLRVLALTTDPRADEAEAVFKAGASGYLFKGATVSSLTTAIREIVGGGTYVSPVIARGVLDALMGKSTPADNPDSLTVRQREVLQLVAEGNSTKQIAAILGISPKTAESHRYSLMKQLGLHTAAALTRYAVRHGVVSDD